MRKEALGSIIAILVIASLGAGYAAGTGVKQTETQTITSTKTVTQTSTSTTTATTQSTAAITNFSPSMGTPAGSTKSEMGYNCAVSTSTAGPIVATLTAPNMGSTPVTFAFYIQTPPQLSAEPLGCSYTFIRVSDANGTEHDYITWKLNFSASSTTSVAGQNLIVSSTNNASGTYATSFSILFELGHFAMYLNSEPLTPWYSDPPCTQAGASSTITDDCLVPQATSISAPLPASFGDGQYQLVLYDTARLYP